jgi:endonuclease/exonuclease/phosphatase family protein
VAAPGRAVTTLVVIAAVGLVAALLGGCGAPKQGSFTVLSYNVAGLPQEISQVDPDKHIPMISPLLDQYDVVLTQEDFDWWVPALDGFTFAHYHEQLRAEATHPHRSAQWIGPEGAGIDPTVRDAPLVGDGLGFLSRMAFSDETRVAWPDCFGGADTGDGGAADCLAGKGFGVVTMTLTTGRVVDVYTLHAEAGGTAEDQALQEVDFDQLADFVTDHSAGRAVILGGDTNLHTDTGNPADVAIWDEFLDATGLTDVCTELSCGEPGSIDKMAYRDGGGVELTPTSHDFPRDQFRDEEGVDLSDHPPLVVGFDWQANPVTEA